MRITDQLGSKKDGDMRVIDCANKECICGKFLSFIRTDTWHHSFEGIFLLEAVDIRNNSHFPEENSDFIY